MQQWNSAIVYYWGEEGFHWKNNSSSRKTIVLLDFDVAGINEQAKLLHFLIDRYQNGERLVAFGSGISLLALTGLLNGKTVSLDKEKIEEYKIKFPQVVFSDSIPFSCDEDIYCSASSLEPIFDHESDIISKVKNISFVESEIKERIGAYSAKLNITSYSNCNARLSETLTWAECNLDQIKNLNQLAEKSFMSRRNFDRQFRLIYSQSPKSWITEKRIEVAVNYLQSSNMCIEDIAYAAGFSSAVNFRNNFKSYIGLSPSEFRNSNFVTVSTV